MAVLPVGAVGDNLRCFQSVFMFVSSANSCFRPGDLFDVLAHSYASQCLYSRCIIIIGAMIFFRLLMEAILRPVQYTPQTL